MKKLILALAGASVALGSIAATPASAAEFGHGGRGNYAQVQSRNVAQNRFNGGDRFNGGQRFTAGNRMNAGAAFQDHRWGRGERFDPSYASNYMVISDPAYYDLAPAPYGYRWVRSGDDAILVAIASGIIGALAANAF